MAKKPAERNKLPGEVWKPVVGFEEQYEVSNMGRVWSMHRFVGLDDGRVRPVGGKFLKQTIGFEGADPSGPKVTFGVTFNNWNPGQQVLVRYVYRLVWNAFRGLLPEDKLIRTKNGDPADCKLSNLMLVPRRGGTRRREHKAGAGVTSA